MNRVYSSIGALCTGLGIAGGAIGTHVLKASLNDRMLHNFETAAHFLIWQGLGILVLNVYRQRSGQMWSLIPITAGGLIFSLLLMAYALTGSAVLVKAVPVGGFMMILGWLAAAVELTLPHSTWNAPTDKS